MDSEKGLTYSWSPKFLPLFSTILSTLLRISSLVNFDGREYFLKNLNPFYKMLAFINFLT